MGWPKGKPRKPVGEEVNVEVVGIAQAQMDQMSPITLSPGQVVEPEPKVIAAQFVAGIPSKFGLTTSLPYPRPECNDVEVVATGVRVSWQNARDEGLTESAITPWSNVVYVRFDASRKEQE
jgi:hypothetical protein